MFWSGNLALCRPKNRGETSWPHRVPRAPARQKQHTRSTKPIKHDPWTPTSRAECDSILQQASSDTATGRPVPAAPSQSRSSFLAPDSPLPALKTLNEIDEDESHPAPASVPLPPPSPSTKRSILPFHSAPKRLSFRQSAASSTPLLHHASSASLRQSSEHAHDGSIQNAPRVSLDHVAVAVTQPVAPHTPIEQEQVTHTSMDVLQASSPAETAALSDDDEEEEEELDDSDAGVQESGQRRTSRTASSNHTTQQHSPTDPAPSGSKLKMWIPYFNTDSGKADAVKVASTKRSGDDPATLLLRCPIEAASQLIGQKSRGEWGGSATLSQVLVHIMRKHHLKCPNCRESFTSRDVFNSHVSRRALGSGPPVIYCDRDARGACGEAASLQLTLEQLDQLFSPVNPRMIMNKFKSYGDCNEHAHLETRWAVKFLALQPDWTGPLPYPYFRPSTGWFEPFAYEPILKDPSVYLEDHEMADHAQASPLPDMSAVAAYNANIEDHPDNSFTLEANTRDGHGYDDSPASRTHASNELQPDSSPGPRANTNGHLPDGPPVFRNNASNGHQPVHHANGGSHSDGSSHDDASDRRSRTGFAYEDLKTVIRLLLACDLIRNSLSIHDLMKVTIHIIKHPLSALQVSKQCSQGGQSPEDFTQALEGFIVMARIWIENIVGTWVGATLTLHDALSLADEFLKKPQMTFPSNASRIRAHLCQQEVTVIVSALIWQASTQDQALSCMAGQISDYYSPVAR